MAPPPFVGDPVLTGPKKGLAPVTRSARDAAIRGPMAGDQKGKMTKSSRNAGEDTKIDQIMDLLKEMTIPELHGFIVVAQMKEKEMRRNRMAIEEARKSGNPLIISGKPVSIKVIEVDNLLRRGPRGKRK
jgi:hypothetical protein